MSEIQSEKKIIFGKYEVGRLLGCGAFAKVYHGRDVNSGRNVAIKVMSKPKIEKTGSARDVKREISVMRLLRHPNIIRIIEVLANKLKIFVIMEFAKGGELFAKVAKGRFSEDLGRRYFRQLISSVGYCHSRGVFHRDLKPENLLLDENWNLKVTDFGLSSFKEKENNNNDDVLYTVCGTPHYVAPEVLAKKGYFGAKIDVWSCGVILFVLTAGNFPFNDTNVMCLYRKIYKGEFKCPRWMSNDLKLLLHRLLDVNPDTRITIDEIIENSWFKKGYKDVDFKFYDEDYNTKKEENNEEGGVRFLNAFDLICFSPGFSLGGLFKEENCCETFLSGEKAEIVVETVEKMAREAGGTRVVVERLIGGMGVRLEGQNGEFGLVFLIHKLTDELVLVEVKKRENNVGPSHVFWKEKLKPKISHLIHESNRVGSNGSLPGPSNRAGDGEGSSSLS